MLNIITRSIAEIIIILIDNETHEICKTRWLVADVLLYSNN